MNISIEEAFSFEVVANDILHYIGKELKTYGYFL
jgi:hypothetical protein